MISNLSVMPESENLADFNTLAMHVFRVEAGRRGHITTYSEHYEIAMDDSHTHFISEHVFGLLQLEMDYCDMDMTSGPEICS